jgi:hypothetical protein
MKKHVLIAGGAFAIGVCSAPAIAQGNTCSDVLRNGVLRTTQIQDNRYYQQIRASRNIRTRSSTREFKSAAEVGIPIEGVPMQAKGKGDYRGSDGRTSDLSRFDVITDDHEVSTFLSSGDPDILREWGKCMDTGPGGLFLRFKVNSPREALLNMTWKPGRVGSPTGYEDAYLTADYDFPEGVVVVGGKECLLASHPLKGECLVTLQFDSSARPLSVAMNTNRHVGAEAYLPQRLRHAVDFTPYAFTAADRIKRNISPRGSNTTSVSHTVQLSEELTMAGWRFDPQSVRFTVEKTYGGPHHRCLSALITDKLYYQITYQYVARRSNEDSADRNTSLVCVGRPIARLIRDRWVSE